MTILGLNTAGKPDGSVNIGFRSGWFRFLKITLGGAGGVAAVIAALDLLEHQPHEGFELLKAWGPWPLIALLGIAVLGKLVGDLNGTIRGSFDTLATSSKEQGAAATRTADALTDLAKQGGRQAEEVRRLAIYAAREFPGVYDRFDRQDGILGDLAAGVKRLHERLDERERQWADEQRNGATGR